LGRATHSRRRLSSFLLTLDLAGCRIGGGKPRHRSSVDTGHSGVARSRS
jgi:hypothetical protein